MSCYSSYFKAVCFTLVLWLTGVFGEGYYADTPSSKSCSTQPTITITSGVATSTVTVATSIITFTVYENDTTIGATQKSYVARDYSESRPKYNSTLPITSPHQTSAPTFAPNSTDFDGCPAAGPAVTQEASSTFTVSTSLLISTTLTYKRPASVPVVPSSPATTSPGNTAVSQIQPGGPQTSGLRGQSGTQQSVSPPSSPGNASPEQPRPGSPGSPQAAGQAQSPQSGSPGLPQALGQTQSPQPGSDGSPQALGEDNSPQSSSPPQDLNTLDIPEPVAAPNGMQGDDLQAGFDGSSDGSSPSAVTEPTSGKLLSASIEPTTPSVLLAPEVPPGGTASASGQSALFTGTAPRNVGGAGKSLWTVLAGTLLFWL